MAAVTYQVEPWSVVWPELRILLDDHWQEIALDKETIALDMDLDAYAALEAAGVLHVITARAARALVGYHVSVVRTHLHYRTSLTLFEDLYYLQPAYRRGWTGVRLFRAVEAHARTLGVQRMSATCKIHYKHGRIRRLFARLRWTATEYVFTKILR